MIAVSHEIKERLSGQSDITIPFNALKAILGYMVVVLLCLLAGYTLHWQQWPDLSDFVLKLPYIFYVIPYYLCREVILSDQNKKDKTSSDDQVKQIRNTGFELPIILYVVFTIVFVLILTNPNWFPIQSGKTSWLLNYVLGLFFSLLPFITFFLWTSNRRTEKSKIFSFMYQSFFPAVITCMISFVYGWSPHDDVVGVLIASTVVLTLFWISHSVSIMVLTLLSTAVILVLWFIGYYLNMEMLNVIPFGILLALGMGVAETWRFLRRVTDGKEYLPEGISASPQKFYEAGTNVATATVPLAFLLTCVPTLTKGTYFLMTMIFVILQILFWFLFGRHSSSRVRNITGLAFGSILPIIVIISSRVPPNYSFHFTLDPSALTIPLALAALSIGMITFTSIFKEEIRKIIEGIFKSGGSKEFLEKFLDPTRCVDLIFLIAGLLSIFCNLLRFLLLITSQAEAPFIPRLTDVGALYFVITFLICGYYSARGLVTGLHRLFTPGKRSN